LELCCGGGTLAIFLAEAGYQVTALDLSESMLSAFRERLSAVNPEAQSRLTLLCKDVCTFDLALEYDFIILEDDFLGYLLTDKDQLACLSRVHRHLRSGGRFLLTNKTPDQELSESTAYDYAPQTKVLTRPNNWTSIDDNGQPTTIREGFERRRLIEPDELDCLLQKAGFDILHRWGTLDQEPFRDPSTHEYIFLMQARKPPPPAGEKAPG